MHRITPWSKETPALLDVLGLDRGPCLIAEPFVGPELVDLLVPGTVACAMVITLLEVPVASWPSGIFTHRTQRLQGKPLVLTGQYADASNS